MFRFILNRKENLNINAHTHDAVLAKAAETTEKKEIKINFNT